MLPVLTRNTLEVALGLFESENVEYYAENCEKFGYELLYCEKTGYYYNLEGEKKVEVERENGETGYEVNGLLVSGESKICKEISTN